MNHIIEPIHIMCNPTKTKTNRLGRVHEVEGDEGGDEAQGVTHAAQHPVQLARTPNHQVKPKID